MKMRIANWLAAFGMLLLLSGICGCETFKMAETEDDSFAPYEPRYVLSVHDVVKYPRGLNNLERKARSFDGTELYYNANQLLSSENIEEVKVVPVPNKPERCRILMKLNRRGRLNWQMAYQRAKTQRMVILLDGELLGDFQPVTAMNPEQEWFELTYEFDSVVADGIAKYAPQNYEYYHPDESGSWF